MSAGRLSTVVRASLAALGSLWVASSTNAAEPAAAEAKVLRVCADPNNLPLSNQRLEGYENKIAELLAQELGWKLEFTWFPQGMGFIRNTLRARAQDEDRYKCDLVIGVPVGFELAATTKPYLRSSYALVYVKGKGLDTLTAPEDLLKLDAAKLKTIKFAVFSQTPPVDWLLKHGLLEQAVSYQKQTGDPEHYPGEVIEKDLTAGKVDVAFAWGPIAGYFAKQAPTRNLAVVAFKPDAQIKFDYSIAMGVRFGEREWKERIDSMVDKHRGRIREILAAYGVPQLDEAGNLLSIAPAATTAGK